MNNIVNALIEIPLGSKNKYELDKETGRIKLDRVLYAAMIYPAEYGIIENTLAPDGDPLDILVICSDPTFPGCMVPARVLGYLSMVDNGKLDYKQSAVASHTLYADYYWYEIADVIGIGDTEFSYFCFPRTNTSVTKARLATEELYKLKKYRRNKADD